MSERVYATVILGMGGRAEASVARKRARVQLVELTKLLLTSPKGFA